MSTPRLNEQSARLTDAGKFERHPMICQLCGQRGYIEPLNCSRAHLKLVPEFRDAEMLKRWQEHDHNDTPEYRVIVLCDPCADRVIVPHPRLYKPLNATFPFPGCMEICVACIHRDGVLCKNPAAQVNGGPGLKYDIGEPATAFFDGTRNGRRSGWRETFYPEPAKGCSGREERKQDETKHSKRGG